MANVLIIDDERSVIRAIARLLLFGGHDVDVAETADAAQKKLAGRAYDIVFCDAHLGGATPNEVHDELVRGQPTIASRVVLLTSGEAAGDERGFLVGRVCLAKPASMATLLAVIAQVAANG